MAQRPVLLLTRPRAQSERFAAEAAERLGHPPVVIAPLIEIAPRPIDRAPAAYGTLLFTSENGVAAFAAQSGLRDRPAVCVGPRTEAAARAEGFEARWVSAEGGDAEALIRAILAERPPEPLLHLRGSHAAASLRTRLGAAGLACDEAVVYAQNCVPLSPEGVAALKATAPVVLPLFSPRSAALAAEAAAGAAAPLHPVAISEAAAARWVAVRGQQPLPVAARPDAGAMLVALEGVFAGLAA